MPEEDIIETVDEEVEEGKIHLKQLIGAKIKKIVFGADGFDLYFSNGFVIETYWGPRIGYLLGRTIAGEDSEELKKEFEYDYDEMLTQVSSDIQKIRFLLNKKITWASEKPGCIAKLYFEGNETFCISDKYMYVFRSIGEYDKVIL